MVLVPSQWACKFVQVGSLGINNLKTATLSDPLILLLE